MLLPAGLASASVDGARSRTQADLETTRAAWTAQRERIAAERLELAAQHEALQADVRALREQWRDVQRATTHREAERAALRRRAAAQEAEHRAAMALFTEFRRAAETRMHAPQRQKHADLLRAIDAALAHDEASGETLTAAPLTLELARALAFTDTPTRPFPGYALDAQGRVHSGQLLRIGSIAYFIGADHEQAGYVVTDPGSGEAILYDALPARRVTEIRDGLLASQPMLPVDVSGGALIKWAQARTSLWERMWQGGVVMIPLLLIGLACLGIVAERLLALRRMEVDIDPVLTRILDHLREDHAQAARAEADQQVSPWRDVLLDAVQYRQVDRAYLEEILQDRIVMQGPRVSQYLGALAICAAAAPLLGLLGTVTGMIHTFQLITVFGTGDARSLSGGISEALITTQFGLIIAVPALLAHAYLARHAKRVMAGLEQAAIRFVRNVKQERETM